MTSFLDPEFEAPVERDGFRSRRARLGRQAGCEHLGLSLFELAPGSAAFPLHYHFGNEEMLIVLSGELRLRTAEGERRARRGRGGRLPVGEAGAHQVINRGEGPARILIASEMNSPDIVVRLDSRKVSAAGLPPGSRSATAIHEIFTAATRPTSGTASRRPAPAS